VRQANERVAMDEDGAAQPEQGEDETDQAAGPAVERVEQLQKR